MTRGRGLWRRMSKAVERFSIYVFILAYMLLRSRINPVASIQISSSTLGIRQLQQLAREMLLSPGRVLSEQDLPGAGKLASFFTALSRGDLDMVEKIIDSELVEYARYIDMYERSIDTVANTYIVSIFSILISYSLLLMLSVIDILRLDIPLITALAVALLAVVSVVTLIYIERSMKHTI